MLSCAMLRQLQLWELRRRANLLLAIAFRGWDQSVPPHSPTGKRLSDRQKTQTDRSGTHAVVLLQNRVSIPGGRSLRIYCPFIMEGVLPIHHWKVSTVGRPQESHEAPDFLSP